MEMFMTKEELQELTGRQRYSAQIRWLRFNRIDVLIRPDGRPMVCRVALEQRMGVTIKEREEPRVELDFSSFRTLRAKSGCNKESI